MPTHNYNQFVEDDDEKYFLPEAGQVSTEDSQFFLDDSADDMFAAETNDSQFFLDDGATTTGNRRSISPFEFSKQNLKAATASVSDYASKMGVSVPDAFREWSKVAGPEAAKAKEGYKPRYDSDITNVSFTDIPGFLNEKIQENGALMSMQAGGGWVAGKLIAAPNPYLKAAGLGLAALTYASPAPLVLDEAIQTHAKELGIAVEDMNRGQLNNATATAAENMILQGLLPAKFMKGHKLPQIKGSDDLVKHLDSKGKDTYWTQLREGTQYLGQSAVLEGSTELAEQANIYRTSVSGIGGLEGGEALTSFVVGGAAGGAMSAPSSITQARGYNKFRQQGEDYLNATDKQVMQDAGDKYNTDFNKLLDSYVGPATSKGDLSIDPDSIDFTPKQFNRPKPDNGPLDKARNLLGKYGYRRSTDMFKGAFDNAKTAQDVSLIRKDLFGSFGEVESGSGESGGKASFNTKRHLNVGKATKEFNRVHRRWSGSVAGAGDFFASVPQEIDNYVGAVLENKNVAKFRKEFLAKNNNDTRKLAELDKDIVVIKKELDASLNTLNKSGANVNRRSDYKPRTYDRKVIKKDKEGFIKSLIDDVKVGSRETAEEMYHAFINGKDPKILTSEQIKNKGNAGKGTGKKGFEKARNEQFDKLNPKFLEQSTFRGLQDYFINSATRAASVEVFGNKGKKLHKNVNKALKRGLITNADADQIWNMYDAEHNQYNRPQDENAETFQAASKVATTASAVAFLGLAPISSITEPAWISARVGTANMLKAAPALAGHMLKGLKHTIYGGRVGKEADLSFGKELINSLGMATNPRESERMSKMYVGDKNVYMNNYFRGPAGLFLTQYTNFVRVWTSVAALKMIQTNANKIDRLKGGKLAGWKNELKENGMTINDFKQINRIGNGKIDMLNDTFLDTRFTKEDGTNISVRDVMQPWLRKITTDIALEPGVGNRPLWMSNPNMQLISQLKSFPMMFGNTIMKRTMRQLNPKVCTPGVIGAVGALGSAATAIALAALAMAIKDEIRGSDKEHSALDIISAAGVPYVGTDSLGQLAQVPALAVVDKFWSAATGEDGSVAEEALELFMKGTIGAIFAEQINE